MKSLNVKVVIDRLICNDEGDGSGNSEPYIWAIFFKLDGKTAQIVNNKLEGIKKPNQPIELHFSKGSHTNLTSAAIDIDKDGMDEGDNIPIPSDVGTWQTTLKSIDSPHPFNPNLTIEIPGIVGVFYLLMEEDQITNSAIEVGHQVLNSFFEEKLNKFACNIDLLELINEAQEINSIPSAEDVFGVLLKKFKSLESVLREEGKSVVIEAVKNEMNLIEKIGAFVDPDDSYGGQTILFTQQQLIDIPHREFSKELPERTESISGGGFEFASDGEYVVTGYFQAKAALDIDKFNIIPAAKKIYIKSTIKHFTNEVEESFIRAIVGEDKGKPFIIDYKTAIKLILSGEKKFYILGDSGTEKNAVEIVVQKATKKNGIPYLKTKRSKNSLQNLWNLPDFDIDKWENVPTKEKYTKVNS
jgi:hypothetical protein